jgi:hypothetical protein
MSNCQEITSYVALFGDSPKGHTGPVMYILWIRVPIVNVSYQYSCVYQRICA